MIEKKVLMVEGSDDEHVIKSLCGIHGIPPLDIRNLQGKDNLLSSFPVRIKESDIHSLGVVIDADTDLNSCWDSLRSRLDRAGYPRVPRVPDVRGMVLDSPHGTLLPRVGLWLMPNNATAGILEDFLRFLVPSGDPLFHHVEVSVGSIPDGIRRFLPHAEAKAIIHTWLAWQEEPGKPLGQSITARYLDANVPEVHLFISWMKRLFGPSSL